MEAYQASTIFQWVEKNVLENPIVSKKQSATWTTS